jgi:hypothetical protein
VVGIHLAARDREAVGIAAEAGQHFRPLDSGLGLLQRMVRRYLLSRKGRNAASALGEHQRLPDREFVRRVQDDHVPEDDRALPTDIEYQFIVLRH